MADIHHHHAGPIIEGREGPSMILGALLAAAVIGFLIWLFAFSGLVFNRHSGTGPNNGGTSVTVNNGGNNGGNPGGTSNNQQPQPGSSY